MGVRCNVPGCSSRKSKRFFSIPYTHKNRFQAWVSACPFLLRYTYHQLQSVRICALHFHPSSIINNKLNKDAVPSFSLPRNDSRIPDVSNNCYLEVIPLEMKSEICKPNTAADHTSSPGCTVPALNQSTVTDLLIQDLCQSIDSEIDSFSIIVESITEPSHFRRKDKNVKISTTSLISALNKFELSKRHSLKRTSLCIQKLNAMPKYNNLVKLNKMKHPDLYQFLSKALTHSNGILGNQFVTNALCNNENELDKVH